MVAVWRRHEPLHPDTVSLRERQRLARVNTAYEESDSSGRPGLLTGYAFDSICRPHLDRDQTLLIPFVHVPDVLDPPPATKETDICCPAV